MNKLKHKAFWIFTGDIVGRGFAFFTSLYLANTLGKEYYGLITVAISILGYATWFSDLGLINMGTRETAKPPEKRLFRITEIFRTRLFLGIIVLVFASGAVYLIELEDLQKQVVLSYLFSIIPYVLLLDWFYAGKQEFGKIALSKILNGAAYFSLVIIFIQTAEDITLVPYLYTIGIATASLILAGFAFSSKPFALPTRGIHIYQDLIKSSSLLGTGRFFGQMIQLLPPLAIGAILSLNAAGEYGVAFKIVIIAMLIDRVFVNILLPNLSTLWSVDKTTAVLRIDTVYRLVAAGGAFIAMIIAICANHIIELLFNPEYVQSIILLQVLSVLIAVTFINSLFSFGLIATNKDHDYFTAMVSGGTIAGFIILVMTYFGNVISAALSVSIAEIVITVFTYWKFKQAIQINFIRPLLLCYPAAFLLFLGSLYMPGPQIVSAVIAAPVFLLLIFKFNLLEESQIRWIKSKLW
ncbi:MAG: hypothetical protein FH748_08580 [Balneolaceae bacterium]|nr:hypothetical protein [Balneolaceae bacterium]